MEVVAGVAQAAPPDQLRLDHARRSVPDRRPLQSTRRYSDRAPRSTSSRSRNGLKIAADLGQDPLTDIVAIGLGTPRPASAAGPAQRQRARLTSSTPTGPGLRHPRRPRAESSNKPVSYLNDGNAGALWGHFTIFGGASKETSVSAVIGTGLGGGVIIDGNVVKGRMGFGGELGHVLIPYQSIHGTEGLQPRCKLRTARAISGSVCSLTADRTNVFCPYFWRSLRATN